MKTKFKKLSDSRVEITVTLDAKDLEAAKEKAVEKLSKGLFYDRSYRCYGRDCHDYYRYFCYGFQNL